jgi:hypothetical protein
MRTRLALAAATAALVSLATPGQAGGSAPQIIDPAGDANGLSTVMPYSNMPTPQVSQADADVTSVRWRVVKDKRKMVTGFTVQARLSAAPAVGTSVVYRMLGTRACGAQFGVIYNTDPASSPNEPQSAVIDTVCSAGVGYNATDGVVVDAAKAAVANQRPELFWHTAIALPKIVGSTMTWTVPLTAIPSQVNIVAGTTITDLRFSVNRVMNVAGTGFETFLPVLDDGMTKTAFTLA